MVRRLSWAGPRVQVGLEQVGAEQDLKDASAWLSQALASHMTFLYLDFSMVPESLQKALLCLLICSFWFLLYYMNCWVNACLFK